jgi:hypothetical protein
MLNAVPHQRSLVSVALLASLLLSSPLLASEQFKCVPSKLKAGDTLLLTMSTPHGGDLGLRTPKGEFFFLVFWAATPAEAAPSLVPWDAFKAMGKLSISADLKLAPWATPKSPRFIFDEPGTYLVLMDENLEADAPARHKCRIHFDGRAS